jgi:DsbC/DsbD-like thiol-disulfide interchange protein
MLSLARDLACRALLAAAVLFPVGASALESAWTDSTHAKVRLLAAGPDKNLSNSLRAGIEIRLTRGWHTYWRYAGDAGIPPQFDWSGSENLVKAEILWPAPERILVEDGIESIGYKDGVVFPLRLHARDASKPIALRLKLDFGVCEKICIPASAKLALDIPPSSGKSLPALDAAETRVPVKAQLGAAGTLRVLKGTLERGHTPRVLVEVAVPLGKSFDLFAEGPDEAWALPLPKRIDVMDGRARFAVPVDGAPAGGSPTPSTLRLTLVAGDEAIEVILPLD